MQNNNSSSLFFRLYAVVFCIVLAYAVPVLLSYTNIPFISSIPFLSSHFCTTCELEQTDGIVKNQSLAYAPKTITVPLPKGDTSVQLGQKELLLAQSENAVLSFDRTQNNTYQLKNISNDTTVLIDGKSLPSVYFNIEMPKFRIGSNELSFEKADESNLKITIKDQITNTDAIYYIYQGKVKEYEIHGQKQKPNCSQDEGLNKALSILSEHNKEKRHILFGGLHNCRNKIAINGIEPSVLSLHYNKTEGYYIRPTTGNIQALHQHIIKYQENGKDWKNFKDKPFEVMAGESHSIKMGYSEFESMQLSNDGLVFIAKNESIVQKIGQNYQIADIKIETKPLTSSGWLGFTLSLILLVVIFITSKLINNKNSIAWYVVCHIGFLIILTIILYTTNIASQLSFGDIAVCILGMLLGLLGTTLFLTTKYRQEEQNNAEQNNAEQTNLAHIMALFSVSVVLLLIVNLDYSLALNISDSSTKYLNDFKKQAIYMVVFLYAWLAVLCMPQQVGNFKDGIESIFGIPILGNILRGIVYVFGYVVNFYDKLSTKKMSGMELFFTFIVFPILFSILCYAGYLSIIHTDIDFNIPIFGIFVATALIISTFIIVPYISLILQKIILSYEKNTENDLIYEDNIKNFRILYCASVLLLGLLVTQTLFGSETGIGGVIQPNELMKFLVCGLISWILVSAKRSAVELVVLFELIFCMTIILKLLNDYSYAFFLLFTLISFGLSILYRRFFWSIEFSKEIKHYCRPFDKKPNNIKQSIIQYGYYILPILIFCVTLFFLTQLLFGISFIEVNHLKTVRIISIFLVLLLVMSTVYLYLFHKPNTKYNLLRNWFITVLACYIFVGIFCIAFFIFGIIPVIPFLNDGNTAERLQVWQSLLSHEQTGYQLLQAYRLGFDEFASQHLGRVPEIDDDFAYTGWLYGQTIGHKVILWFAVFLYAVSLLWLIRDIGMMPYFKAINIANQNLTPEYRKYIVQTAERYKNHNFSASVFALCALSIFATHTILSLSTNTGLLPVVGQPFPYLGRQGSHLVLYEFLVVLTIIWFLINHSRAITKETARVVGVCPTQNGWWACSLPKKDKNHAIQWEFYDNGTTTPSAGAMTVCVWSRNAIQTYLENPEHQTRSGYTLTDNAWWTQNQDDNYVIEITAQQTNTPTMPKISSDIAGRVQIIKNVDRDDRGNKRELVTIYIDKQELCQISTTLSPQPQENTPEQPALPANNPLAHLMLCMIEWGAMDVRLERFVSTQAGYTQGQPFEGSSPFTNQDFQLDDDEKYLKLADWYISTLTDQPDEFVLYMQIDEDKKLAMAKLLVQYATHNEVGSIVYWRIGNLRISQSQQPAQAPNQDQHPTQIVLQKLSVHISSVRSIQ